MPFAIHRSPKLLVVLTLGLAVLAGVWVDRLAWAAPANQGLPPPGATATLPPPGMTPTTRPYPSPSGAPPAYPGPSVTISPTLTRTPRPYPYPGPIPSVTGTRPSYPGPSVTPSRTPDHSPTPGPSATPRHPTVGPSATLPPSSATPRPYPYPGPSATIAPPTATRTPAPYPYPAPTIIPPANDECRTATLIPSNGPWPFELTQDTRYALPASTGEMALCGGASNSHTVWFRWTAPTDGPFEFSTCGSNYDTVVTVWRGECFEAELVACNDDTCDRQARVLIEAQQGTSYLVRVASYNLTAGGALSVHARFGALPTPVPPPPWFCPYPGPYPYLTPCYTPPPTYPTPTPTPTWPPTATLTPGPSSTPVALRPPPTTLVPPPYPGPTRTPYATPARALVTEFDVPTGYADKWSIVAGPDGALWFTEAAANRIGRITVDGVITEYPLPPGYGPLDITVGPDGALWYTRGYYRGWEERRGGVGRITTSGHITEYGEDPTCAITTGPDGALWFLYQGGYQRGRIGRLTMDGQAWQYSPSPNVWGFDLTCDMVTGQDGGMWITMRDVVARFTTGGELSRYQTPSLIRHGITVGPDRAIWFTEEDHTDWRVPRVSAVSRLTPEGIYISYTTPSGGAEPIDITVGPDQALWFTENRTNQIGRLTLNGVFTEYALPPSPIGPWAITTGPDGAIWFTRAKESGVSGIGYTRSIGRLVLPEWFTPTPTATPTPTYTPTVTPTPTVTLTPTPSLTPTITPTPTPVPIVCDPNIPGNMCNGTVLARVYIDMVCDNYYNAGIDWLIDGAEMTVRLSNGQVLAGRGNANGYVTVQGVHVLAGTTVSVTLVKAPAPEWVVAQGYRLGMCRQASPTRILSGADFREGVAQIEYRLRLE